MLYGFCRADERSVIRRMSDPHTADNAALIRPTIGVVLGNNRISTIRTLDVKGQNAQTRVEPRAGLG